MATLHDGDYIRLVKTITVTDSWGEEEKTVTLPVGLVGFVVDGLSHEVEFRYRELAKKDDPAMYGKNNPAYFNDFDEYCIDVQDASVMFTIHEGQFEKIAQNPDSRENA